MDESLPGPPAPLAFQIDPAHFARRLCLEQDRAALASLAGRCLDYLRFTSEVPVPAVAAPEVLRAMLRPQRVPVERSFVLGIYAQSGPGPLLPTALRGVLYFLHPPNGASTWYLTLLLLQPSARGQGLGAATHRAFARWAMARGSRRLVVAVARNNPRALRFWRDHMGYSEAPQIAAAACPTKPRNRNFEHYLQPAPAWN